MNVDHPFATPCDKCQHQLTSSPTEDESVPHCAWARQGHVIKFLELKPTIGKSIPVCRQFAPKGQWADLIPAHPLPFLAPSGAKKGPAIMPRTWIYHQIRQIINKQAKDQTRYMFEFLTARPMNSSETARGWFLDQLDMQGGSLSDEQLWTLMVWALAESARLSTVTPQFRKQGSQTFLIPADSLNRHFVKVSEIKMA